jgi:CxxC motif-containing protein (DUF1111 family)
MRHPRAAVLSVTLSSAAYLLSFSLVVQGQGGPSEAPAGFDNRTNGMVSQTEFDAALATFAERDEIPDGLGPVYNAQSCAECHQNPVVGAISQISELRAGHLNSAGTFVDAPGGSLINDRAVDASIQERVPGAEDVRSFRMSTNTLGDGFVEAINSNTLIALANAQPGTGLGIAGQAITVPVVEAPGNARVGRFGWKNQHASLQSFAADAYLNEIGVTSRLQPVENTSMGRSILAFDPPALREVNGFVEDEDDDVSIFATFMRATKVPPRDTALAATSDAIAGSQLFDAIGCNVCHTRSITTSPAGTAINGNAFIVPAALGNKTIHPFSDYLLHDIGTGDGIVQNGGPTTRNKVRTLPLWGARTHGRHMHDGESLTFTDAILRHAGEATTVLNRFRSLSAAQRNAIVTFLQSL